MTEQAHTDGDELDGPIVDVEEFRGITAALVDERMAEPDEHPAPDARAFTLVLQDSDGNELHRVTYTVGPGVRNPADARAALHSAASDAEAVRACGAPEGDAGLDFRNPDSLDALDEFASMYGYEEPSEAVTAYVACVEARNAFDLAGVDLDAALRELRAD